MMPDPFLTLVERMRHAQKAYFLARTPDRLKDAKYLEKLVDVAIEEERKPRAAPSLFDRLVEDVEKV
jgi:hypothetical protein